MKRRSRKKRTKIINTYPGSYVLSTSSTENKPKYKYLLQTQTHGEGVREE